MVGSPYRRRSGRGLISIIITICNHDHDYYHRSLLSNATYFLSSLSLHYPLSRMILITFDRSSFTPIIFIIITMQALTSDTKANVRTQAIKTVRTIDPNSSSAGPIASSVSASSKSSRISNTAPVPNNSNGKEHRNHLASFISYMITSISFKAKAVIYYNKHDNLIYNLLSSSLSLLLNIVSLLELDDNQLTPSVGRSEYTAPSGGEELFEGMSVGKH